MSLIATSRSMPGTLRQDVLIDGRHRLTTDEPEHLGGEGTARRRTSSSPPRSPPASRRRSSCTRG